MEHLTNYLKEQRPWGGFERFTLNEPTTVKIITVNDGESLSLQTHKHRDEFWRILSGSGLVQVGEVASEARAGDVFFCQRGSKHRVSGGTGGISFLEGC